MLERANWRTPNRVDIHTGHVTFDRQCEYIGTGNVIGNAQSSSYVRPHFETECNGRTFQVGHLHDFDLGPFRGRGLPQKVWSDIKEHTACEQTILYEYRHWRKGKRVVHGYVLTTAHHIFLGAWVTGPTRKSRDIIRTVLPYVAHDMSIPAEWRRTC